MRKRFRSNEEKNNKENVMEEEIKEDHNYENFRSPQVKNQKKL